MGLTTDHHTRWRMPRRAVVCWVRQAVQQCRSESPRPCVVFLTTDSEQVRAFVPDMSGATRITTLVLTQSKP